MAIRFDGSTDTLRNTTGGYINATLPYTITGWVYPVNVSSYRLMCTVNLFGLNNNYHAWGIVDGQWGLFQDGSGGYSENASGTASTNTWYRVALVFNGSNQISLVVNGSTAVTLTTTDQSTGSNIEFGNAINVGFSDFFNGRMANFKVFDSNITADQIAIEHYRYVPTFAPLAWYPMILATDTFDQSGNGRNLTAGGTLTTEDGPPVTWGAAVLTHPFVSVGAGEQTVNPTRVESGSTVYQPTITTGAVTVSPNLVSSASEVYQPTVTQGAQEITPNRVESASTVYQPTVTPGAVTITANRVESASSIYQPLILPVGSGQLRFYGTADNQVDRVRIPQDGTAINLGGSFTYEFWLNCAYANNATTATGTDVRDSNCVIDHDVWNDPDRGWVLGVTRDSTDLVLCFGASPDSWSTMFGSVNVGDNADHHVALVRNASTGLVSIYVDGVLDVSATYDTGDWSIALGTNDSGGGQDNAYLVIGTEKHDFVAGVNGYNGYFDALRISDIVRYSSTFTPPARDGTDADGDTVGLYQLDELTGTIAYDWSGNNVHGELLVGGTPEGPEWVAVGLTISPNRVESASSVYQPTITVGAVTVSPNRVETASTVYQPTVTTGAVTISPNRVESASNVYQPTITVGTVTVSPNRVESASSVYQPTITTGAVTISPNRVESASEVYEPTVAVGYFINANRVESASEVYQPTITVGAVTITVNRVESASNVYAPTITTTVTVSPNRVESASSVYEPTITQGGVTISPNRVESASNVYQPTVTTGAVSIAPNRVESISAVYQPTVMLASTQTINANRVESTSLVYQIIVAIVTVNAARTYTVPAELRQYTIDAEARTFEVVAEDRTFVVS